MNIETENYAKLRNLITRAHLRGGLFFFFFFFPPRHTIQTTITGSILPSDMKQINGCSSSVEGKERISNECVIVSVF